MRPPALSCVVLFLLCIVLISGVIQVKALFEWLLVSGAKIATIGMKVCSQTHSCWYIAGYHPVNTLALPWGAC